MINKWPFDSKEYAKLLWIKSPFRAPDKEWMTSIVLQSINGDIREFEIPWGLFPNYRLGQYYSNGLPVGLLRDGSYKRFNIEHPDIGEWCSITELPSGLSDIQFLGIKDENLWSPRDEKMKIFIPCIEIVRCFLAPNGTLARALLDLGGLDLIAAYSKSFSECRLVIDQSVPKGLVTNEFVCHLAWIFSNPLAYNMWISVLQDIGPRGDYKEPLGLFNEIIDGEETRAKKLKVSLPLSDQSFLDVRGIEKDDQFLVLEIIGAGDLKIPYKNMSYSQYHKRRKTRKRSNNQIRRKRQKENNSEIVIVDHNPSRVSKTIMTRNKVNTLSFKELPNVYRTFREQHFNKGDILEKPNKKPSESKRVKKSKSFRYVSGADILFTGDPNISPVEVIGPHLIIHEIGNGLELFLKAIDYLPTLDRSLTIQSRKIDYLPAGKKFSLNEYGGPRKYACITIKWGKTTRYVIEIERFTKVFLASLIIEPRDNLELNHIELYKLLDELLTGLILNYGKWNNSQIQNQPMAKIRKVKHLDSWSHIEWAFALYNRL